MYAGRDVQAETGRDILIEGGRVVAERDVSLDAGRDLSISAALNTGSSSVMSSSTGLSVGVKGAIGSSGVGGGLAVSAHASGAHSSGHSDTWVNAVVEAGDTLSTVSGRDMTVAGAYLQGDKVHMDVGGNLTVVSLQDRGEEFGSSWSIGGEMAHIGGFRGSANLGGGSSHMSSGWVTAQTSVWGQNEVTIHVEDGTHLKGGLIASAHDKLLLDTGSLSFSDLHGSKTGKSLILGLSGNYDSKALESITSWGGNKLPVIELGYASYDRNQTTRATVGKGQITVRDGGSLEGLNRNIQKAQEESLGDDIRMNLYISPSTIEDIITEGLDGDLGRAWTFSNTIIGLTAGAIGTGINALIGEDTEIIYDWNAINFINTHFYKIGKMINSNMTGGAITFGNIELYSKDTYPNDLTLPYLSSDAILNQKLSKIKHLEFSTHEEAHTYQYQHYGPFYGIFYLSGGFASGDNKLELDADQYSLTNMHRWGKNYPVWITIPHF